jgi:hypothetical protein
MISGCGGRVPPRRKPSHDDKATRPIATRAAFGAATGVRPEPLTRPPTQNDGGIFRQNRLPKVTLIWIKGRAPPGQRRVSRFAAGRAAAPSDLIPRVPSSTEYQGDGPLCCHDHDASLCTQSFALLGEVIVITGDEHNMAGHAVFG